MPPSPLLPVPEVPRRERELAPRERDVEPLERELVLRDFVPPLELFAAVLRAPVELAAPLDLRLLVDLRAPDVRLAPEPEDVARDVDFFAPVERLPVERELFDAPLVERFAVERDPDDLRAPLDLPELVADEDDDDPEPVLPLDSSVGDHLPAMKRWAASATASAIIDPSLVALEATLLAARSAVSAASRPASRIFLRAAGLALIAAAAAARPAASISLLIAAFASLSTVVSREEERDGDERFEAEPDDEDLLREELLRVDLAIALTPSVRGKDTLRPFRFPNEVRTLEMKHFR